MNNACYRWLTITLLSAVAFGLASCATMDRMSDRMADKKMDRNMEISPAPAPDIRDL